MKTSPSTTIQLKSLATDHSSLATVIVDKNSQVVYANKTANRFFRKDEPVFPLAIPEYLDQVVNAPGMLAAIHRALQGERIVQNTTFFIATRECMGTLRLVPVLHAGAVSWCVITFDDQTKYIRLQRRLTRDEFFDNPTGLLNRKTLEIMLELELEKASRDPREARLALMLINIRNMESLRAVYKAETINLMLEHLGNSVRTALRSNDLLFRYDDNRILVIVNNFKLKTDLLIIAERAEDQIAIPFHDKETNIHLQASIGIAVYPDDGESGDALQSNAASAVNQAMEEGRPWLMFNQAIHERAMDRLFLRSGLSQAVRNNELELRYMSLVDAAGVIKGTEVLLRWRHPQRGLLGPDTFLPVAIHSRIIGAITRWVLYRVIKDWEDKLHDFDIFVTMNLSAYDFNDDFFVDTIKTATAGRIPPGRLKVEITESECIENIDRVIKVMKALGEAGVEVLIDDFGVGQSSLSYLKDLPAHYAKIDRAFLSEITTSELEQVFLGHIISLGKVRGLEILIEGVETAEEFDVLKTSGACLFQGHHFGEPMPLDDFIKVLSTVRT